MSIAALGLALLIGVVGGSRTFMAPAAVAWAAFLGGLEASGGWLLLFGHPWARWIWSALSLFELVVDQLPSLPSRTVPVQFGGRIVSSALCGAAVGASAGSVLPGAIAGIGGAVIGTLGGQALRGKMAAAFGNDHLAALVEDALALALALAAAVVIGMP